MPSKWATSGLLQPTLAPHPAFYIYIQAPSATRAVALGELWHVTLCRDPGPAQPCVGDRGLPSALCGTHFLGDAGGEASRQEVSPHQLDPLPELTAAPCHRGKPHGSGCGRS